MASIRTPPCTIGLRFLRPKRLFGFAGTTGGEPCSPRALKAPREVGLPPATAPAILAEVANDELQEGKGEGVAGSQNSEVQAPMRLPRPHIRSLPSVFFALQPPHPEPSPPRSWGRGKSFGCSAAPRENSSLTVARICQCRARLQGEGAAGQRTPKAGIGCVALAASSALGLPSSDSRPPPHPYPLVTRHLPLRLR